MTRRALRTTLPLIALLVGVASTFAQTKRSLILNNIDNQRRQTVAGNIRPEVTSENDRGLRDSAAPMPASNSSSTAPPEDEAAFKTYSDQLTDPTSPNYHKCFQINR